MGVASPEKVMGVQILKINEGGYFFSKNGLFYPPAWLNNITP